MDVRRVALLLLKELLINFEVELDSVRDEFGEDDDNDADRFVAGVGDIFVVFFNAAFDDLETSSLPSQLDEPAPLLFVLPDLPGSNPFLSKSVSTNESFLCFSSSSARCISW